MTIRIPAQGEGSFSFYEAVGACFNRTGSGPEIWSSEIMDSYGIAFRLFPHSNSPLIDISIEPKENTAFPLKEPSLEAFLLYRSQGYFGVDLRREEIEYNRFTVDYRRILQEAPFCDMIAILVSVSES